MLALAVQKQDIRGQFQVFLFAEQERGANSASFDNFLYGLKVSHNKLVSDL
jgi:hypothetical protein